MKIEVEVKIPMTPNFICVGEEYRPIKDFTDSQLREIGKLWAEDLVKNAKMKRLIKKS